jgi:ADP-dependent NAD(P)H-hydrate dehydratase / NAD(P)H-hydrate epimerase
MRKHNNSLSTMGQIRKLDLACEIKHLPPRKSNSHKGDFGHVLIIGGDYSMGGAVRMAGESALRVGAGLVTVATRPQNALMINAVRPEIMASGIKSSKNLLPLLRKATVVVIGPGLGTSKWGKSLFNIVVKQKKPMVIDADALNLLSTGAKINKTNWVLTPHPGEAARLLKTTAQKIQDHRILAVKKIQQIYGGVAVLKGSGTLIAAKNKQTRRCDAGNPGMATAGMGDVLSGIIAGLIAQGLSLHDAAKLGVLTHAEAADRLARKNPKRGILAMDLLPEVRKLLGQKVYI